MLPQKQEFLHKPEDGQVGDCFRAALASLMNLHIQEVPHFLFDDADTDTFWKRVLEWLGSHGLAKFTAAWSADLDELLNCMSDTNPGMYYLLAGTSPRGTTHQVIALNDKIVHDPHPEGGGLVGPCKEDGLYWVDVLVPKFHSSQKQEDES